MARVSGLQNVEKQLEELNKKIETVKGDKPTTKKVSDAAPKDNVAPKSAGKPANFADMRAPDENVSSSSSLPKASWSSSGGSDSNPQTMSYSNGNAPVSDEAKSSTAQEDAKAMTGGTKSKAMAANTATEGAVSSKASTSWPSFDASSFAMTLATDNALLDSWDQKLGADKKSQQLVMLLFYVMKRAESGDLGAMYDMMKVLTYIISKDQALKNIYLGKKLIQLQQQSREMTNLLTNTDTADSNEFMKVMQTTQSEQQAITMSQKLLTTMMEEAKDLISQYTTLTQNMQRADASLKQRIITNWS